MEKLISAAALERELLDLGFYPAIVKRVIERAPEALVRCEECEFGKMPGVTHDKERYRLCVVKAPRIVGVKSFCSRGIRRADNA